MKAYESIPNFKPNLRMYANFSARTIKKICGDIGPRLAGSEAEKKAQDYLAEQVGECADEIKNESFSVSPHAFLGWIRGAGITLFILSVIGILNIFVYPDIPYSPIASLIGSLAVTAVILVEFLFYKELTDKFSKKATSHNTYCIRKPIGDVKRRIIFDGHSDSSIEWRYTRLGGKNLMLTAFIYPAIGLAVTLVLSVIMLINGNVNPVFIWIEAAFIPGYIGLIFFMNYKVCVDGANDNLTGCLTGAAVLKFMGDKDIRFQNTEVIAMFSGAEESGLRGVKAAVKLHPEWKDSSVETVFLAFDTIKEYEHMAIYSKDMSGLVKNDSRACALLKKAGETAGVNLPYSSVYAGASNAAAATQAKIPAACLAAMDPAPPRYYHTNADKADILELKTIEKGIEIALEAAFLFDEQGLKDSY